MTFTIVNNSVFRGFFEKHKVTKHNFIDWYCSLRIVLLVKDKLTYLEHPIPGAPIPAPRQQIHRYALDAHTTWVKDFKEINYNMHDVRKTVNELHDMLKLHEKTLPKKDVAPALHAIRAGKVQKKNHKNKKPHMATKGNNGKGKTKLAYAHEYAPVCAPKPKIPPSPKKDNPAKDAICHQCGNGLRGSMKLKPGALDL
uniref:Zinc finger, CCHC-type n=1 Tax=Tanacetum cinerariifolium TaxID=118510 RepID=A0A699HA31_TANCI|nr:zinc finger, CCHC-type [Tanacetum cinerariifolium]